MATLEQARQCAKELDEKYRFYGWDRFPTLYKFTSRDGAESFGVRFEKRPPPQIIEDTGWGEGTITLVED